MVNQAGERATAQKNGFRAAAMAQQLQIVDKVVDADRVHAHTVRILFGRLLSPRGEEQAGWEAGQQRFVIG